MRLVADLCMLILAALESDSRFSGVGGVSSSCCEHDTFSFVFMLQAVDKTMGKVGAQGGGDPQTEYRLVETGCVVYVCPE